MTYTPPWILDIRLANIRKVQRQKEVRKQKELEDRINHRMQGGFTGAAHAPYVNEFTGEITHTPMTAMHTRMVERVRERMDGYQVTVMPAPFFDYRGWEHPMYLGSFTWTCVPCKLKWIHEPAATDIGAGVPVTPGDIARHYLSVKYADRRIRCTSDQYDACVKDVRSVPLYARPGALYDGAVYFDLTSAYWQIVRAVGWDTDYMPKGWLSVKSSMTDFPYRHEKMARNCLVSVGLSRDSVFWTGHEIKIVKGSNRLKNMLLWRLVCDVLNGIAHDCVRAGATYCHTDGYIVSGSNASMVAEALDSWGCKYGVRHHGDYGVIRGVGSYQVGAYQSKPYRESLRQFAMSKVYDPGVEWLRPRFRRAVEQADKDWMFWKGVPGYDD